MLKIMAIGNLTDDVELKKNEVGRPYAMLRIEPFPQKRTEKQMKKRNKNKIKKSKVD